MAVGKEAMAVGKEAVDAVAARAPRVSLVLKADLRPGVTGAITTKVETIERFLSALFSRPPLGSRQPLTSGPALVMVIRSRTRCSRCIAAR